MTLFVFVVGGYYVAGWLLKAPWMPLRLPAEPLFIIPRVQFPFRPVFYGPWVISYDLVFQLAATLLVAILGYALLTIVWGVFFGPRRGLHDAPPPRPRGPMSPSR